MLNNVKVKKFAALEKLVANNWIAEGLNFKEGEDNLQLVIDENVLMAYIYKGGIEVSFGENEGNIDKPEIFPSEVWALDTDDFDNNVGEIMEKVISFR
ncbi:hypothetical protein [Oceanobacillus oncorhynchi]|uniref:hypothetical protein n=1 Tax=Oceanobacillus oncorhynchi TaxID=545501 RepID=UPI0034D54817